MAGRGRARRAALLALVALGALLGSAATASARVTAKATLEASGFTKGRVVVEIDNTARFTTRNRPRAVSIVYKRKTYRLRHVAHPATATPKARSVWRSSARSEFRGLYGKRIAILVRTAAGTARYRRKVGLPAGKFDAPARPVSGDAAFARIKKYFVNSQFTDCAGSACATEHRYLHCAGGDTDGTFEAHAFPPLPGSELRGRYHVITAFQDTDGSWGVTYQVALDSGGTASFTWLVQPDGSAQGGYQVGSDVGALQGYHWRQPAGC